MLYAVMRQAVQQMFCWKCLRDLEWLSCSYCIPRSVSYTSSIVRNVSPNRVYFRSFRKLVVLPQRSAKRVSANPCANKKAQHYPLCQQKGAALPLVPTKRRSTTPYANKNG